MELNNPLQLQLGWEDWHRLEEVGPERSAPESAGVYRISHSRTSGLEYIGYGNLCERIYRLSLEINSTEMPYRDPHIAAPCLWALNEELNGDFWVSWIIEDEADKQELIGKKAALISQYRLTTGQSPTANFGRMIEDYSSSTRYFGDKQGGKVRSSVSGKLVGEPPNNWNSWEEVCSENWMGYNWSGFEPLSPDWTNPDSIKDDLPSDAGIIRLRENSADFLIEIECVTNIRKGVFKLREQKAGGKFEVSYAMKDSDRSWNRYEVETDLVGAHYIAKRLTPESEDPENQSQIMRWIKQEEHERQEFKQQVPDNGRKLTKDMIALANKAGGRILIGVQNDGEVVGVDDLQNVREDVTDFATSDNIKPEIDFSLDDTVEEGERVVIVEIQHAEEYPHSQNGVYYIREGPSSNKMSGKQLKEFFGDEEDQR